MNRDGSVFLFELYLLDLRFRGDDSRGKNRTVPIISLFFWDDVLQEKILMKPSPGVEGNLSPVW